MNKNLGRFIFLALLAFWLLYIFMPLPSVAGEVAILKGESAITFAPVWEKAESLVEIELVSSSKYPARYERLKLAVFRNDWRPRGFANDRTYNPGKCTVGVLADSYVVDCWLEHLDRDNDTFRIKVLDPDMVIGVVLQFSKKRE